MPPTRSPDCSSSRWTGRSTSSIRARYDEIPKRAVERLESTLAGKHDAILLGIEPGAAVMLVERIAYTANGRALEHSRDLFVATGHASPWNPTYAPGHIAKAAVGAVSADIGEGSCAMMADRFDADALYRALDAQRIERELTWAGAGVSSGRCRPS